MIGRSDNMPKRWGTHPGLSEKIVGTVFAELHWKKKLSKALHLLDKNEIDVDDEDEEIKEIGMRLYEWKMYKHATYWFEKSNSKNMALKCKKMRERENPEISE